MGAASPPIGGEIQRAYGPCLVLEYLWLGSPLRHPETLTSRVWWSSPRCCPSHCIILGSIMWWSLEAWYGNDIFSWLNIVFIQASLHIIETSATTVGKRKHTQVVLYSNIFFFMNMNPFCSTSIFHATFLSPLLHNVSFNSKTLFLTQSSSTPP